MVQNLFPTCSLFRVFLQTDRNKIFEVLVDSLRVVFDWLVDDIVEFRVVCNFEGEVSANKLVAENSKAPDIDFTIVGVFG